MGKMCGNLLNLYGIIFVLKYDFFGGIFVEI